MLVAQNTMHKHYSRAKLQDAWRVDRHGEKSRFSAHDGMDNRKLLWHGTRCAAVFCLAILVRSVVAYFCLLRLLSEALAAVATCIPTWWR